MKKIIVMAGPTASGKSALALMMAERAAAHHLTSVIINADSQQIYRDLRILTARPSVEEEAAVPHALYGVLNAAEACSAGHWLKLARIEIDWALSRGRLPIVVGGTGLYISALLHGIAEIPPVDSTIRAQAESDYVQMGKDAFAQRLQIIDPDFFRRLKVYDRQRLIRAYEVWLATGRSLSDWQAQTVTPPYPREQFHLLRAALPRPELYRRCDARFSHMLAAGAVEEVKELMTLHLPTLPLMRAVGVRELSAYLCGETTLEAATHAAQQETRRYAKRQETWMRNQLPEAVPVENSLELSKNLNFLFAP